MNDCIFCKIARGEIPSTKVFENDEFLAFLDIAPANKGHTLVVPKKHFVTLDELPDGMEEKLFSLVKKIAKKINLELSPPGYNILLNNKKTAGQVVPHLHCHIIPRFDNDQVEINWKEHKYKEGEMEQIAKKINLS